MLEAVRFPALALARVAAMAALVVSLVAQFLAASGITDPMQPLFVYPMRHTTAFCVSILSGALIATCSGKHTLSRSWSTATGAIALIALVGLALRWSRLDSDADSLPRLFSDVYTALPNALSFLMGGAAVRAIAAELPSPHRVVFATIAGAVAATLGVCGLLNEIFHIIPANPAFEGELAVDATLSVSLIGIAILCVAYIRSGETVEPIRFAAPLVVAVVGTMGSFMMWRFLLEERSEAIAFQTANAAATANRAIDAELRQLVRQLRYTADLPEASAFQETAMQPEVPVQWADSRTLEGGDSYLRNTLPADQTKPFYGIGFAPDGAPRLVLSVPKKSGGMRVAAMPLHDFFDPILTSALGPNFKLALLSGGGLVYRYPDSDTRVQSPNPVVVRMPDLGGQIRLEPRSDFVRRGGTASLHLALVMGLNASFLLAFSVYLLHAARARLAEVLEVRAGLELEIEQRRATEEELDRKAKLLQASNTELQEFAHVVSHDLQEPLRSISGFAQLLARRYKTEFDTDAHEFLEFITESSLRMSGMIQGLLAYSRLTHEGDIEEVVPLSEAVYWAKSNLVMAIVECGAVIEDGELPNVKGNRLQFCQLMQNLIGNAIKYRGAETPSIRIAAEILNGDCVITVSDNGLGIGPEFQERIFGLFKRAHGKDYAGAGVGLALCKKIVERHGGQIWVESTLGRGSQFHFRLPVVSRAGQAASTTPASPSSSR